MASAQFTAQPSKNLVYMDRFTHGNCLMQAVVIGEIYRYSYFIEFFTSTFLYFSLVASYSFCVRHSEFDTFFSLRIVSNFHSILFAK
jgi:hypothetical protein